jgi:hypothetical protein
VRWNCTKKEFIHAADDKFSVSFDEMCNSKNTICGMFNLLNCRIMFFCSNRVSLCLEWDNQAKQTTFMHSRHKNVIRQEKKEGEGGGDPTSLERSFWTFRSKSLKGENCTYNIRLRTKGQRFWCGSSAV